MHAHRRGGIAVDDDLALRLIHALDVERIALLQIRCRIIVPSLGRRQIQRAAFALVANCLRIAFSTSANSISSNCAATPT